MTTIAPPAPMRGTQILAPAAVMGVVLLMVAPRPPLMLDLLLSTDIGLSVVLLLTVIYVRQPVEFSVFPSLLLLLTLVRLSLNVASTRLILLHGQDGVDAAGHVIMSFGQFVVGGNFIVGTVVFLVLIAIQFIVINHGAVRISEVTARFTLDALPGRQMAIDADLNAGMIDEKEARARREQVRGEADFYGAMDGAIRFTQRDALAAVLITAVNIGAVDPIGVEVGYALVGLVDEKQGGTFLSRVRAIRRQIATETGVVVSPVRVADNLQLGPRGYSILIKGIEVARGELHADRLL